MKVKPLAALLLATLVTAACALRGKAPTAEQVAAARPPVSLRLLVSGGLEGRLEPSDPHGHDEPDTAHSEHDGAEEDDAGAGHLHVHLVPLGGAARAATAFLQAKHEAGGATVLALDAGNFSGAEDDAGSGRRVALALAAGQLDACAIGYRELALGVAGLRRLARELPYPLLSATLHSRHPGSWRPHAAFETAGVRTSVIGMTVLHPEHPIPPDLWLEDPEVALEGSLRQVVGTSDVVVVLGSFSLANAVRWARRFPDVTLFAGTWPQEARQAVTYAASTIVLPPAGEAVSQQGFHLTSTGLALPVDGGQLLLDDRFDPPQEIRDALRAMGAPWPDPGGMP